MVSIHYLTWAFCILAYKICVFKSVKSLSVSLDEIVKRQWCVWFVWISAIYAIKVVKDVIQIKNVISMFTFQKMFRNQTLL